MSIFVLYEVAGDPQSSFPNAIEIKNVDASKEIFLSDLLQHLQRLNSGIGCSFSCYVLIEDKLVWLESPASLVPVCPDGFIRILLKPTVFPTYVIPQQCADFCNKSRAQLYSKDDYERTAPMSYCSFNETARRAPPSRHKYTRSRGNVNGSANAFNTAHSISSAPSSSSAAPFTTSRNNSSTGSSGFDTAKPFKNTSKVTGSSGNVSHGNSTEGGKYVDSHELRHQFDNFNDNGFDFNTSTSSGFANFDAFNDNNNPHNGRDANNAPYRDNATETSWANGDCFDDKKPINNRNNNNNYNSNYHRNSAHANGNNNNNSNNNSKASSAANNNGDINLNSIVGDDTAAVLADAAEAAGVAAKSFFSFASNLGKSVLDIAQSAATVTNNTASNVTSILSSDVPSRLLPGSHVQVR